jgi:class 3 adenylate cyclase
VAEERKLVTVLFADIVDSTALSASHDPEVIRATLARTFEALREVLVGYGATVEKFIGDAVMAVFGVPRAQEDDAERAVRAAFALRDRIARLNAESRIPVELRVGVNSGEAVAGTGERSEFLVTGAPVNAASRLQAAAAPGEILAGALTVKLTRGAVRYADPRPLAAKGFAVLEGWPARELRSPVPEMRRSESLLSAPLIGREEELALLERAFTRARESRAASLVTILGAAGSGKSRLTNEFVSRVAVGRLRSGRCLPYGDAISMYPMQLVIRAECGISSRDDRVTALAKLRRTVGESFATPREARVIAARIATLAGLLPADEAMPEVPTENVPEAVCAAARRFFEQRAARDPLVLLFEDLHWAEPILIEHLEHFVALSQAPLVVVCLARPEFRDAYPRFGATARDATTLVLDPLSPEETRRLIRELLSMDSVPDAIRAEVVARAEGNPFYVEEFIRALIDTGRLQRRDGRWLVTAGAALDTPATLVGLITARLDRLEPAVKRLLQRASLVGRSFSVADLDAIGGESTPIEVLQEAIRGDLLSESEERALRRGPVYRFRHVLIRDVAYSTVPKGERAKMHDNYCRWLEATLGERRDAYADVIAFHAEQAFLLANEVDAPACEQLGGRALELLQRALTQAREGPRAKQKKPIVALEARIQALEERLSALAQRRILARR